jgi:hypothetical protein
MGQVIQFRPREVVLICSCCGIGVTATENTVRDEVPYPFDEGFGMCVPCGGDESIEMTDEESVRKRLGWAKQVFFQNRFDIVREQFVLGDPKKEQVKKWDSISYIKKCAFISELLEKGVLKW